MENDLQNEPQTDFEKESLLAETDKYASQKTIAQGFLNATLLESQIGTLVIVLRNVGNLSQFEIGLLSLLCLSIFLQLVLFLDLVFLFYLRSDSISFRFLRATHLNLFATILSGILMTLNIAIIALERETLSD